MRASISPRRFSHIATPRLHTVALMICCAASSPASAALLLWNNAAGGTASTAGNWNPSQAPVAADDLTFNLNSVYSVTYNASVPTSRTQVFRDGQVTLSMSSPHTTTNGVTIGDLNTDVASVILTTGTWTSSFNNVFNFVIGDAIGSTGTLNVNDDDADLVLSGALADFMVGNNGAGTLNITGGGLVTVSGDFVAGTNATSTSNVTISGFVAQAPFPISRLDVLGTGLSSLGQGGDATVNISNGALADFAGNAAVALGAASTSTVTVQGQGLIVGARMNVDGDLLLGRNLTAASAGGNATLNINADGNLDVGDTLFVAGDPDGGTATLHLADEGAIVATSMHVGAGGTLDLDGGTLDIDGGSLTVLSGTMTVGGADHPVVTMINGAQGDVNNLRVGDGAGALLGDFDVRSGSDLVTNNIFIGDDADDTGSMIVNGTGSTLTPEAGMDITVGVAGSGHLEAELGGGIVADVLTIASQAGSDGVARVESPDSTMQFNQVFVGGSSAAAGGDGTLIVNQSGALDANFVKVWPTGVVDVTSAYLDVAGNIDCLGRLQMQGTGLITLDGILFVSDELRAHPNVPGGPAVINGRVSALAGSLIVAEQGDLILGSAAHNPGFTSVAGATIDTGAHTITLMDAGDADVDTVVMAGGTLSSVNGIRILDNGSIDGTGTIDGDVFYLSGASVITATGASGITINGLLRNNSGFIDGTKFTFNGPDGGWEGAGAINASVVFNSGASVNAIANMTMGVNTPTGVTFNAGSELYVDDEVVTLVDSNGLGLPSVTEIDNGSLVCAQGLIVNNGRVLGGRGTVQTPLLTIFGSIIPGDVSGILGTGQLTMTGDLDVGVNSHVFIDVGGTPASELFDVVVAAGALDLNGKLHVNMLNGFSPAVGTSYGILGSSSLTGTFASFALERPGPGKNWKVVYNAVTDSVVIVVTTCIADITHNGSVDVSDLLAVINGWGACPVPCPPSCEPDTNADCQVNVTDLLAVINAWGACP